MSKLVVLPQYKTIKTDHITEEEMFNEYNDVYSWISDDEGIIEVTLKVR